MAIAGDLEQLMTLQQVFTRNAQSVEELTSSIRSSLANTRWEGPAADRFRTAWNTEFETALRRLSEALTDCSAEVSRRREALQQAGS